MKNKIISNHNDLIGVILYNTKTTDNPLKFSQMSVKMNLEKASAQKIKESLNLFKQFDSNYGSSENGASLHEVLWLCSYSLK
jgi:ATP-dependent DNA helicase 2 subunit 1